jgi:hypothetical protein
MVLAVYIGSDGFSGFRDAADISGIHYELSRYDSCKDMRIYTTLSGTS